MFSALKEEKTTLMYSVANMLDLFYFKVANKKCADQIDLGDIEHFVHMYGKSQVLKEWGITDE